MDPPLPSGRAEGKLAAVSALDGRATAGRIALVMVGLPARGKTHMARRVARYLRWLGVGTRVFNVGNYRRQHLGSRQPARFFDPDNVEGNEARARVAMRALDDMLAWFGSGGEVGIYDATNTTRERRRSLASRMRAHGLDVVFVESVCEDESVIESNIRQTKLHMPDYAGVAASDAVSDFRARIAHYERAYEPVEEDEGAFVRVIDVGRKVVAHRIQGYLPSRLVYFLMNLHVVPRSIWLTRHGQSSFNVEDRVGGDPSLSPAGREFAASLGEHVRDSGIAPRVWISTLARTAQTAAPLGLPFEEWRALDEIDSGDCDGMTYGEIRRDMPAEHAARRENKLTYRYPRGESYLDVIRRLEPVIFELERERRPVLVIAHQAVLRSLYAYLMDRAPSEVPYLPIPLHTIIKLTPITYECDEERVALSPALA
ncbi:MAG: 6-phosphofructo-2-kinase/fructose-2,6-bisphosphatase [Sandaracinaceae bacterium]|nr:6-phosphofructo-2-kinase/fructose-2,6-bisphosphatase [Sandaracinaceae bacterium]